MNELMREEILDQPDALTRSLPDLRAQVQTLRSAIGKRPRVIFTGSGDSYCAGRALILAAHHHTSRSAQVIPSFEAVRYWTFGPTDLLIAISVSGQVRQTVEAAETARRSGALVLAITAAEVSPLSQTSDLRIILPVRSRSRSTPHTTDYLTTLLALAIVIEAMAGLPIPALDRLAEIVGRAQPALEQSCRMLAPELAIRGRLYFLGAGPSRATAKYAALKFWEAGGINATDFDLDEFAHGPHLLLEPGDPVFLTAPEGQSVDRAVEIARGLIDLDAHVIAITSQSKRFSNADVLMIPSIDEEWSPFLTALPYQWLCWAVATEKGWDVVRKNGRIPNPDVYSAVHYRWVRGA